MEDQVQKTISDRDVLQLSLRIEQQGQTFYEKLAEIIPNPVVREFIEQMQKEEAQHEKVFRNMLETKGDSLYGWENKKDLQEFINAHLQADIFPSLEEVLKDDSRFESLQKAVDFALEAEMISAEFYSMLGEYCDNLEAKTSLTLLEQAENEHLKQVLYIKQKLLKNS
jgi:rubrerythrin